MYVNDEKSIALCSRCERRHQGYLEPRHVIYADDIAVRGMMRKQLLRFRSQHMVL